MKNWCAMYGRTKQGFTLLELTMAIMILAVMMLISFFCFDAVVQSWNAGIEMADSMAQADYVMEQVVSGLRSAFYPDAGVQTERYGFQLYSDGDGEDATDSISWTKIGRALVGERTQLAEVPHRVELYIDRNMSWDERGLMVKAWRDALQIDDFDPEEDVEPFMLAPRVIGFDCRVLKEPPPASAKEVEWEDEWKFSNSIPYKVSLTFYMRPLKEREEPLAITRDIEIPLWDLSQNPVKQGGSRDSTRRERATGVGGGREGGQGQQRLSPEGAPLPPGGGGGGSRGPIPGGGGGGMPGGGGAAP